MNKSFVDDLSKAIKNSDIEQRITPGSVGRRYEPPIGVKKHNERIHKESKYADDNKKLPFSFSKPSKSKKSKLVKCCNCDNITYASINTIGIICSNCHKYSAVEEV
jgi:hypothetical protein